MPCYYFFFRRSSPMLIFLICCFVLVAHGFFFALYFRFSYFRCCLFMFFASDARTALDATRVRGARFARVTQR